MKKPQNTLKAKLSEYKLATVNIANNSIQNLQNNTIKSTLLSIAPFAAGALLMPMTAQAQCGQGTATFNAAGGAYGDGQLDVDGDGNADFDFDINGGNLYVTPVGTMSVGIYSATGGYAQFISSNGVAITGNSPQAGFVGAGYPLVSGSATFNNGTSGSFYIVIKDGAGKLGFFRYTKDGAGGFSMDLSQTGVSTGTNNIVTGSCPSATLPVELVSFEAKVLKANAIQLNWVTASETNNKGFEVQRSIDGFNFHKIGWLNGEEGSERLVTYGFTDKEVKENTKYYYRLRQIDFDGTENFSDIRNITISRKGINITISPNPVKANSDVVIDINTSKADQGKVELFNVSGQLVHSLSINVEEGENAITLPIANLKSGTYVVKVRLKMETIYQKILIE